ncbi:hypothetical protein OKA04_21750 [Luteolibacter flavescens]|uniref:DUF4328 domain-containing protein n=1 Tax=Luteolibacter flavescens TaxID=1859460 RepID=A0ABT3FVD8_9BACT|nr:hypothetical protein [Luteolibacter flavescens]MCW1887377.1 hypothetical protein [Luteolibacter flavescens]
MKRDITIPISAILVICTSGALLIGETLRERRFPGKVELTSDSPAWQIVVFLVMMIAVMRAVVLWFQTISDITRTRGSRADPRYGWLICHFIFPLITPYLYYYFHRTLSRPIIAKLEC